LPRFSFSPSGIDRHHPVRSSSSAGDTSGQLGVVCDRDKIWWRWPRTAQIARSQGWQTFVTKGSSQLEPPGANKAAGRHGRR
jgi:hypothetical protein